MHCPECDGISYSRKTKTPEWRCRKCGHEWDMGPALNTSSSTIPVPKRPGIDNLCQWEPQFVDSSLRCRRRIDSGHPQLCILHLPDPNKSRELFSQALREKFVQDESNPQVREINLAGVVFSSSRFISLALGLQETRKRLIPIGGEFVLQVKPVAKRISFAEATFLTAHVPYAWVDFRLSSFHGMVSFQHARFDEAVNFMNVQFHAGVNFSDARFGAGALFGFGDSRYGFPGFAPQGTGWSKLDKPKPTIFGGNSAFRRTQFDESVTFSGCRFNGVDFSEARFSENADFMGTEFNGNSIFKQANFEKGARFGRGDVEYVGVNGMFVGDADFSDVKFHGHALFGGDVFHEGINRVGSTAWQLLNFRWRWPDYRPGPFGGNANFTNAQFDESASFDGAHFAGRADFRNARFPDGDPEVGFNSARFSGDAIFNEAKFGARYNFYKARFGGEAIFVGAVFPKEEYYNPQRSRFHDVQFKETPNFGYYQLVGGYPIRGDTA